MDRFMALEIVSYKAEHALEIIKGQAKQPTLEINEQTIEWAKMKENRGPAVTGIYEGRIIGCGGLEIIYAGFAEGWCLFVADIGEYGFMPKAVKRILAAWIEEYKLIRIQAPLRVDFPEGIRFAEWLGLEYEGLLRKYHADHSDARMFALIIER